MRAMVMSPTEAREDSTQYVQEICRSDDKGDPPRERKNERLSADTPLSGPPLTPAAAAATPLTHRPSSSSSSEERQDWLID